ncbi:MAG TPA: hypothetical protein DEG28_05290 [Porphyromonadaceae bacterium]|nr:hypothetical protein [Porphyromonadaceae bacterium]HBK31449.1 hypothetical protein [Porphyromonadaceae bacterium]HBX20974.1 hypothetical protein [Porphyromonadaceae bacterium]HBX45277.1 hypothetical protein [Porphyromonadaceae bacterium]HCM20017.1 hypothetical protein [Porphyromonadaceae bacterium]
MENERIPQVKGFWEIKNTFNSQDKNHSGTGYTPRPPDKVIFGIKKSLARGRESVFGMKNRFARGRR